MNPKDCTFIQDALKEITLQWKKGERFDQKPQSFEELELSYSFGYNLYQAGSYSQSKEVFRELILAKPLTQKYWFGLGSCLQMEQEYEEALKSWSMAALLDDEDPLPHFHAAECLFSAKQVEEGKKALKEAKNRVKEGNHPLKNQIESLEICWIKDEPKVS